MTDGRLATTSLVYWVDGTQGVCSVAPPARAVFRDSGEWPMRIQVPPPAAPAR
jgi:hypothetical protein